VTALSPIRPIAIVTGFLGSGKTTLISRLLRDPDMGDTAVIVNEFGEVGLDHHLIKAATDNVILLPNGCLCCSIRQDIVQTLRELYKSWLTGEVPNFRRVIIETTGLAEPAPLVASVGSHPLLADAFALRSIITLVDAEHGLARLASSVTNRNQICLADRLVLSKCDLVEAQAVEALESRLVTLNPLAPICRGDQGVSPDFLFTGAAAATAMFSLRCDTVSDHLAGISSLVLRSGRPLAWPAFQMWLNDLLNRYGSRIMRIKGQLSFEGHAAPLIIQAVHHTFYPVVEAKVDEDGTDSGDFLVFVFEGDLPQGLEEGWSCLSTEAAGP
jgi:G3E family GTPase